MSIRRRTLTIALVACGLAITACGSTDAGNTGVASLSNDGTQVAAPVDDAVTEEELLDWTQCMRDQGVNIPDPEVDADGNLQLGGGRGQGRPPGAGTNAADDDEGTDGAEEPAFDREAMQTATEKCGDPPFQAVGGFSEEDQQERQDATLKFAECMRGEGIDFPDPDFSQAGPGGPPGGAAGSAEAETDEGDEGARPQGPFGDIDMDDPEVQAAFEACQDSLGELGGPGGGPGGGIGGGARRGGGGAPGAASEGS